MKRGEIDWTEWRKINPLMDENRVKKWLHTYSDLYDVEVTVKSVKGFCEFGNVPGQKVYFDGRTIKGDVCIHALGVLFPFIYAMRHGANLGIYKKERLGESINIACPDPTNQTVFEVRRIRRE